MVLGPESIMMQSRLHHVREGGVAGARVIIENVTTLRQGKMSEFSTK
jgi:hypothetical protein